MTEPPDDPTLIRVVDVYKNGDVAATLERTPAGVRFSYTRRWLDAGGDPVATTLPVVDVPVVTRGNTVPVFFAGLLPEGRRLSALRREVKTSADDELSLLLAVGGDLVGDVQLAPAGTPPAGAMPMLAVADFADVRFSRLLADMGIRADRVGLPGVQDKASAAMINLPVALGTGHGILKLNPPEFRYLVENEAFFLDAARRSGLDVNEARLVHDAAGEAGLFVTRFDRIIVDGRTARLAVEDGCQVLGIPPGDKYLADTERMIGALAAVCAAPAVAARTFLAQLTFAFLTANGDAHAKNFAVLRTAAGEWRPSPAYDLPSSQPYGDTTLALPIGGSRRADVVAGSTFVAMGTRLGVPEGVTRSFLRRLVNNANIWLPDLDKLPFDPGKIRKLRRVIDYRCASLLR